MSGPWARSEGVTLTPIAELPPSSWMARALADGLERGIEATEELAPGVGDRYLVRAAGEPVALLALLVDLDARAAAVTTVAVDPDSRGHAYGTRALRAVARRLARDGVHELFACVPVTNGRGFYFMLRAGYAPVSADAVPAALRTADGESGAGTSRCAVSWFRRASKGSG